MTRANEFDPLAVEIPKKRITTSFTLRKASSYASKLGFIVERGNGGEAIFDHPWFHDSEISKEIMPGFDGKFRRVQHVEKRMTRGTFKLILAVQDRIERIQRDKELFG